MNNFKKIGLLIFVLLYWASPIDLIVGPIDDIIITLLTIYMSKRQKILPS